MWATLHRYTVHVASLHGTRYDGGVSYVGHVGLDVVIEDRAHGIKVYSKASASILGLTERCTRAHGLTMSKPPA
jgi:predicted ATP-grasp superfamily ATP-dependent carboligase